MSRAREGYKAGAVSVISNTTLFIIKLWAGLVTGSVALTADAWHTLSDSISSIVVIVSVRLSSKKPDNRHPFGHGRWEQIAVLIIAFMLAVVAFDFLRESVVRFRDRESVIFGTLAIVVTVISLLVKEALAQYVFMIARKTDNLSLKADAWHHRTDALSSLVILAGILLANRLWWIDSLLGAIVSVMLFYTTWQIAREAVTKLLGEKPSQKLIDDIISEIGKMHEVDMDPHHFHIHNYVTHRELTFHIRLARDMTIEESHLIVQGIESRLKERFGIVATVRVEPLKSYNRAKPQSNL